MRRLSRRIFTIAGMMLLCRGLVAEKGPREVPFKLYRDYTIIVKGSIGRLRNRNLLIDTGAVPSVLDSRVAKKLRLEGKPDRVSVLTRSISARRVELPSLRLGPIQAEAVPMLVRDLSCIEEILGVRVDAMVGLDVLAQGDFTIDYTTNKLVFGPAEPSGSEFAIQAGPGFVYATVQMEGQSLRLVVDTGTNHLVLFGRSAVARLAGLRILSTRESTTMGGEVALKQVQLREVRLGSTAFHAFEAFLLDDSTEALAGLDGLLGIRALGPSRVGFNFTKGTICWK